jgi:chromate transport protein ChrA
MQSEVYREFAVTVAQASPEPSTYHWLEACRSAIVANIANLMPPVLFVMFASLLYSRYKNIPFVKAGLEMVQYAVFAMIIAVAVQLVDKSHIFQLKYVVIIAGTFALFLCTKLHPALIIIGAGALGAILR